jgi:hypothetical protein
MREYYVEMSGFDIEIADPTISIESRFHLDQIVMDCTIWMAMTSRYLPLRFCKLTRFTKLRIIGVLLQNWPSNLDTIHVPLEFLQAFRIDVT